MKVDFISFPTSPESPQSDSVCNRGDRRKLEVCCSLRESFSLSVFSLIPNQNKSARVSKI